MFFNSLIEAGAQSRVMNQTLPRVRRGNKTTLKGTTGTQNFAGQITGEDLNREWDDPFRAVCTVDVMRKSCVRTRQSMMLLKTPILGATMRIEPVSDSPEDMKIAEFVEATLFDSQFFRWSDVIRQQMTYLDFGHSVMEKAYTRIDGQMILSALEFRKQQTVLEWHATEGILHTVTQANVFNSSDREAKPMPAEQVLLTTYEQEGGNFGGFSALRPAWINWKAKMFLIKGDQVRYERFGIGTPLIETKSQEIPQEAIEAVQNLRSNDQGFIAKTKDWALSVFGGDSKSGIEVHTMVLFHDHQILFNVMGNFMTMSEGKVGSFAVTKVGADMFFNNVEREANHLEDVWNKPSGKMANIPQIVRENFGEGVPSPNLRIENLEIDDLDTFATRAALYVNARLLDPTPDIRKHILERERLPLQDFRDNEQLDALENVQPTLKKLSNGRPYVLQYTRSRDKILRLRGAKRTETTKESQASEIVSAHLASISAVMALKGRSIVENSETRTATEKACRATKIPNSAALVSSLVVGLDMQSSSDEFVKWIVDHFYEQIRKSWTSAVLGQYGSSDPDLSSLAKVVAVMPTKEISGKVSGVTPVIEPAVTSFPDSFWSKDGTTVSLPQGAEKPPKKRRGRNVTPETLRLERKICDMKGIKKFLEEADKRLESVGQKHRDDLSEFLVTRGAAILNSSSTIDEVVRKINAVRLDTEKLAKEVDREIAKVFRFGIDEIRKEVGKQVKPASSLFDVGRPVIEDQKEARKSLEESSKLAIFAFSQKLLANWKESILNLYKRAEVSTEFIRDRLNGVSQKLFTTELSSLSSESFGVGRGVQMNRVSQEVEIIIHTEVLDSNTCQPCLNADGLEFTGMSDPAFAKFRNGQNPACLGGNRCRGFNFMVMEG